MGVHLLLNVLCSGDRACNVSSVKERMIETGIRNISGYLRGEQLPLRVDTTRGY
jgi:hypothetical protein